MRTDQVSQLLGELNGKMDMVLRGMSEHNDDDTRRFAEIENRQMHLEVSVSKVTSKVAWFSGAWAIVGAAALYIFKGH